MADLKTTYAGLELKNPIIVGSSNLVTDMDALKQIEDAGAAAIVYKSLFEEQIQLERAQHDDNLEEYNERHAEMVTLFPKVEHAGPEEHLHNLSKVVEQMDIPVIGSLNCVYDVTWGEYAKKIAETGVKALELNFYASPANATKTGKEIVEQQMAILKKVKHSVDIPVTVKLSPFYTNIVKVVSEMDALGVDGFVMFNRVFQPDVNIETEQLVFPWYLSNNGDHRLVLRFAGLLYDNIKADIAGNTGILTGDDVIQTLLSGADVVQVVSTLYKNGISQINHMLSDIQAWMDRKGYANIDAFKGKLSRKNVQDPFAYKRAQYVDILMKSNEILKKYPMR